MPSPITPAIRESIRARFEADQIDQVRIVRPGPATTDADGVVTAAAGAVIYEGQARLRPAVPSGDVNIGEGGIAMRQMPVQVPIGAGPFRVNDVLTVLATVGDPQLVGTDWQIGGVDGGGSFGAFRELSCTGQFPNRLWGGP